MKIKHDSQGPRTEHECEDCKPQHAMLPWRIDGVDNDQYLVGANGETILCLPTDPTEMQKTDVHFLIRAVNCHEELMNCLKSTLDMLNYDGVPENDVRINQKNRIRQAIAKAQGGQS